MSIPCCVDGCSSNLLDADKLFDHINQVHKLPAAYIYRCSYPTCVQKFSTIYSFKKHVKTHKFNTQPDQSCSTTEFHEPVLPPPQVSAIETPQQDVGFDHDVSSLKQSALELTLRLHHKSNITRQDALDVQHSVQQFSTKVVQNFQALVTDELDSVTRYDLNKKNRDLRDALLTRNTNSSTLSKN